MRLFGGMIMGWLSELGIDNMCAGGYPRDLAMGLPPRDFDIVIYGKKALESEELLRTELTSPDKKILDLGEEQYKGGRIAYVIKLGTVDIICYNAETEEEVFDAFDYNINQYKMELGKPVFKGENEFTLTPVRGDILRLEKMLELAKCWKQ